MTEDLNLVAHDRRITVLEENAKRFDRDLREVKTEMQSGFQNISAKMDTMAGKIDSLIITNAQKDGKLAGGVWVATKIMALIGGGVAIAYTFVDVMTKALP